MRTQNDLIGAQPARRRLLFCSLASGLGVMGCAASVPDARRRPLETTPVVTWRYAIPEGSGLTAPSVSEVASALAAAYGRASRYGALRDGSRYYANLEISAAGTRQSGLEAVERVGVEAVAERQQVQLTYARGLRNIGKPELISKTRCTLVVSTVPGQPDQYAVNMTQVDEVIARDMFVFAQPPLDTIDAIRQDVIGTLNKIRPVVKLTTSRSEEIDSPYSPAAVLANFERAFGRNDVSDQPKDRREGRFETSPVDGKVSTWVRVRIDPFRTGSKVSAKYGLLVHLRPDGASDFDQGQFNGLHMQVRKAALQ